MKKRHQWRNSSGVINGVCGGERHQAAAIMAWHTAWQRKMAAAS